MSLILTLYKNDSTFYVLEWVSEFFFISNESHQEIKITSEDMYNTIDKLFKNTFGIN